MSDETNISALYHEFTDALTEVLAENAVGPARRGRLARARAIIKRHPAHSEHEYFVAVETAFIQWEAMQNAGRWERLSHYPAFFCLDVAPATGLATSLPSAARNWQQHLTLTFSAFARTSSIQSVFPFYPSSSCCNASIS